MKNKEKRFVESLLSGFGMAKVRLDCSNATPRIRAPNFCSEKLQSIKRWRICYLGKWKLALVPLEMWEDFCIRVRKEFERQNPNTCFDSWVREPAKDVELQVGKAGIRWYIPQYFLAWSKIPVKKGTLLYLYRAHLWIIISLTEQHSDAIPNNSSNIPDCSSITPDPS